MADAPRRGVGRPRLAGSAKYIRLRISVFDLWRQKKSDLGYSDSTDSVFAEFLLHRRTNVLQHSACRDISMPSETIGPIHYYSTPIRGKGGPLFLSSPGSTLNTNVDVTGVTSDPDDSLVLGPQESDASLYARLHAANDQSNTLLGNPFSLLGDSNSVNLEGPDDGDSSCSEESVSGHSAELLVEDFEDDMELSVRMSTIIEQLVDDSDTDHSLGDDDQEEKGLSGDKQDRTEESHTIRLAEDMDMSAEDDERTLTMVEDISEGSDIRVTTNQGRSVSAMPTEVPSEDTCSSSKKVQDNKDRILSELEAAMAELTAVNADLRDCFSLQEKSRFLVSKEKLTELAGDKCSFSTDDYVCNQELYFKTEVVGSVLAISTTCDNNHFRKWMSSEVLTTVKNNDVYVNDCMLSASVIVSGNNYSKFKLLCQALGLNVIKESTFLRFQKHCAAPVVEEVWTEMNNLVIRVFKAYEDICLCGDGRNDSPGHCARYCVYTLMEHFTSAVIDFEVIDKRETGGNSTTMEKEALRRLLEKLAILFPFDELTTDASPAVIKLVRELKEKFPQLMNLFHSLDIWHKAKKLSKALHQAARIKGCSDLREWIDAIITHFWFCSETAEGSEEEIKNTWEGVLHHICGEHSWALGRCKYSDTGDTEEAKKYLKKDSKAMAAFRKIVLDPKWLKTLHFYVRFRHTSELESYNSMMTKYVPKRMAFEYPYFIMRVTLAAIDHNLHLFRKPKSTKAGKQRGHRKYSKRTQKFHAEPIKEEKTYSYFPFLISKMLHRRTGMEGSFNMPSDRNEFDPKQIAPTIGMKEPPPTEELMKGPSRFLAKPKKL